MDVTAPFLVAIGDYLPDDPACPTHSLRINTISAEYHAQYPTTMKDSQREGGGRKRTLSLQGALLRLSHISPSPSRTEFPRSPLQAETPRSPLRDRAPSPLSSDLLDDDPFAASPASPATSPTSLYHDYDDTPASVPFPVAGPSTLSTTARPPLYSSSSVPNLGNIPEPPSRGRQVRPAASRPAIMPRPSLPSLNTLAHSDYVYPRIRARAGTLGARLPVDPWANDDGDMCGESLVESPTSSNEASDEGTVVHPSYTLQLDAPTTPDLLAPAEETQEVEYTPVSGTGSPLVSPVFSDASENSDSEFLPVSLVNDPVSERTSQMFSAVYDVFTRFTSRSPPPRSTSRSSSRHASTPSRGSSDFEHTSGAPTLSPSSSTESESSAYSISTPTSPSSSVYSLSARVHSPDSGASLTPTNTMYMPDSLSLYYDEDEEFVPGSADTVRVSWDKGRSSMFSIASMSGHDMFKGSAEIEEIEEAMDADGYGSSRSRAYSGGNSQTNGNGYSNGASTSRGYGGSFSRSNGAGAGGSGGDDPRRPYQSHTGPPAVADVVSESDDDDKPLAQSIPGALRAQRTIRRQAREETAERRRQRSVKSTERATRAAAPSHLDLQPPLDTQTRSEARTAPQTATVRVGAQDIVAPAPVRRTRGRAATISGQSGPPQLPKLQAPEVMPDDLVRRLQGVQMAHQSAQPTQSTQHTNHGYGNVPGQTQHVSYRRPSTDQDRRAHSRRGSWDDFGAQPVPPMPPHPAERTLRPQRSLHNLPSAPPAPSFSTSPAQLGRSNSLARSQRPRETSPAPPSMPAVPAVGASLARSRSRREPDEAQNGASLGRSRSRREPDGTQTGASLSRNKSRREQPETPELPPAYSAAIQTSPPMRSRSVRRPGTAGADAAPPVPVPHTQTREPGFQVTSRQPHQGHTPHLSQSENRLQAFQQRVYVFDMQRFHMVELGANTRAQDVLAALETQGVLDGWAGAGGWALCEIAQDLGMERPLRPFESVNDVLKSWDKGQMKNVFLAKKCALADTLSARNLPSALPRRGAYVDYEVKRGSWKKRWLELREQGLWLAKKDTGKDEVFLCSISSFDAYTVTRPAKSPKPFTFAVKSTDNLTFFENVADYVHVFSCGEGDGRQWIEKIMLGRSYIMNQERNVIASAAGQPPTPGLLAGGSGALKRSGTRKREVPAQPLIDVSPPAAVVAAAQAPVFEPGSLLARR